MNLLEKELNGELTPTEALELERTLTDKARVRRRLWREVSEELAEEPSVPGLLEARIGQGVRSRLAVRECVVGARPSVAPRIAWAAFSLMIVFGFALVALERNERTSASTPIERVTDAFEHPGASAGPVEIEVLDRGSPFDNDDELVVVTF